MTHFEPAVVKGANKVQTEVIKVHKPKKSKTGTTELGKHWVWMKSVEPT